MRKIIVLRTVPLLMLLSLLFSCEDKSGACEIKIDVVNYSIYSCSDDDDDSGCSIEQKGVTKYFHKGTPCTSLGYKFKDKTGDWIYEEGNLRTPGPEGAFKDDVTAGGANCNGGYQGPSFDIQIDSQCQTAYVYRCAGADDAADAACAIYKTFQKSDPSIPNCPYCN